MGSTPTTGIQKASPGVSRRGTLFCIAVVRGRTGRRAAARNQQSGGLLVSPRETPSAAKEARKDAGERAAQPWPRWGVGFPASRPGGPCRNDKKDVQRFVTPHVRESFYFRPLGLLADFNCSVCFDKISDIEDCEVEIIFVFILVIITFFNKLIYNSIEFWILAIVSILSSLPLFLSH